MEYEGRVFRPPSEAKSLIIQMTVGCSNNTCAFCDMYKEKKFHIRDLADILADFDECRKYYRHIDRIFLADGDALICKTQTLLAVLEYIRKNIPECSKVTCYASPRSIRLKSDSELALLRENGLYMVYMGLESGSDRVLELMRKGNTRCEIIEAGQRVKAAGLRLSVTAISGLGGEALWQEHARETASAFSAMKPDYIGLLTLMLEGDTPLRQWIARGDFKLISPIDTLRELKLMLELIDSEGSVFRMNHASNYLMLRGTLNSDRAAMIKQVEAGIEGQIRLKPESFRAL